jgi:hypothetical protein
LDWTTHDDSTSSAYIQCVLEDSDLFPQFPVYYYVSIRVKNGAGDWSDIKSSSPIKVVPEDVAGNLLLTFMI